MFRQTLGGGVLKQISENDFSQSEPWYLDYEFLGMSLLWLTPDKIDCTNETSVNLDRDVASSQVDALDADDVTLSQFVGNDS